MFKPGFLIFWALLFLFTAGCLQGEEQVTKPSNPPRDVEILFPDVQNYTSERTVNLLLFARDVTECRFSHDGQNWEGWEKYRVRRPWNLTEGDGIKQVFYQCRNAEGNISVPVAATIVLDTTPPTLSLESPVTGQIYGDKFDLVFTADDSVSESLRCSANLDGKPLKVGIVTAGRRQNITVYTPEGIHNLAIKCRDNVLSTEESVSFEVAKAPTVKLTVNDGSGYTDKRNVTLNVESPTAVECRFSNKKDEWGEWAAYSNTVQWAVSEKEGTKNVYAQCKDSKGVVSDTLSDRIALDTSPPPYISLTINNDVPWTNSRSVTLGLYAFAASECRYSNDGTDWGGWEPYKRKKTWTLSEGEGEKTVYYNCRKRAGEDIGTVSSSIRYSIAPTEPPYQMSVKINGDSEYTSYDTVSLELSALGAYQCRFREGSLEWSSWQDYATKGSFTISESDGAKTIYYQCMNDFGTNTAHSRIYLDRTPPEQVAGLKAEASPYAVLLYWNAAKDAGVGVKVYMIFRSSANGTKTWAGVTTGLNFKDERVVGGETYQYTVQAVDSNNNYGKESASVSVQIPEES